MRQELFGLENKLCCHKGLVSVHASTKAFRLKKTDGRLDFAKKSAYKPEELLEEFEISGGYKVQPNEHVFIETQEKLHLSPKVGFWFLDNPLRNLGCSNGAYAHMKDIPSNYLNSAFVNMPDGWIDPGYEGTFSRQPKWINTPQSNRIIKPGDEIGYGCIIYFPNGVEKPYGTLKNSQYQGAKTIRAA